MHDGLQHGVAMLCMGEPSESGIKVLGDHAPWLIHKAGHIAAVVSVVALGYTLSLIFRHVKRPSEAIRIFGHDYSPPLAKSLLVACWTILPPVWFWFEFFFIYQNYGLKEGFEAFKHGQQVAVAIWAGLLAFFVAVFQILEKQKPETSLSPL